MHVLIIGGTSFTGPHIVTRLVDMGHQVAVFHRGKTESNLPESVRHIHGGLSDFSDFYTSFKDFKPDVTLHMMALTAQQAWTFIRTVKGITGRTLVVSSSDVYRAYNRLRGKEFGPPDPIPLAEEAPLREQLYPYRDEPLPGERNAEKRRSTDDYEKILVERIVMSEPGLPGTVLRLPAVYGPNDPQHRMFEYLKRMDDQRPAILMEVGAAQWRFSRGFVEDVALAISMAVVNERSKGEIYNVGEADALTEQQWVEQIGRAAGWGGKVLTLPKGQLPDHLVEDYHLQHHLVTDTTRIRKDLGYQEIMPRGEAIQKTIAWERANPPGEIDQSKFDYAAEDAVLKILGEG